MTPDLDQQALEARIARLEAEHAALEGALAAPAAAADQLARQRLKRHKLAVKDEIARLRAHLGPDIIA